MSDMKCIKCNSDLEQIGDFYTCTNPHCTLCGDKDMWQELIKLVEESDSTRKVLDVAVDALKRLEKELYFNNAKQTGHIADSVMSIPSIALEQITALKQKDVK